MAGAIGDLIVRLGLDVANLRGDIGKSQREMDRFFGSIDKGVQGANRALSTLATGFGALIAALSVREVVDGFKQLASRGDEIADLSQALGLGVKELQAYQFAAEGAGMSSEDFAKGVKTLAVSFQDAAAGGKSASAAFAALGIDAAKLKAQGMSTSQVLDLVTKRLQEMPDGFQKIELATTLFGKNGLKWIEAINDGLAEQKERFGALGGGLSESLVDDLQQADKAIRELKVATQGALANFVEPFIEPVTALIKAFTDMVAASNKAATGVNAFGETMRDAVQDWGLKFAELIQEIINEFRRLQEIVKGIAAAFNVAKAIDSGIQKAGDALTSGNLSAAYDAIKESRATVQQNMKALGDAYRKAGETAGTDFVDGYKNAIGKSNLARALGAKDLFVKNPNVKTGGTTGGDAAEKVKKPKKLTHDEEIAERAKALGMSEHDIRELEQANKASETYVKKQAELAEDLSEVQLKEANKRVAEGDKANEKIRKQQDDAIKQGIAFQQSIEDVFTGGTADFFTDIVMGTKSVSDAFSDMAKSIAASLARIAAQKVAEQIFGGTGTQGGASSGILSSIFSWAGGLFGGAKAIGGPMSAGSLFRVGEAGPEYVMPMHDARIVPESRMGGSGATNNLSIAVNVPPVTDRRTADQMAASVGVAVQRAMKRNQ